MKKIFLILLSVIYLVSTAGATIQLHYCMDKLVGAGMHTEDEECGKCGMKKQDGCCKDESKQVKLESDQKPSSHFVLSYYFPAVMQEAFFDIFHSLYLENKSYYFPNSNGPPLHTGTQLYKYLRVFRI